MRDDSSMADTTIEWTDATWNPVAGCTVITAGCTNCYAMRMAARLSAMGQPKYRGLTRKSGRRYVWTGKIRCDENSLDAPRSWTKPRRVFVNSMSDLFHEDVPVPFIRKVWHVMQETPRHTYQILTKRPERMLEIAGSLPLLPNVWLGRSARNEEDLEKIEQEIDNILKAELKKYAKGESQALDAAALGLAAQRLEHLINYRRNRIEAASPPIAAT
jgi:protein gp37